MASASNYYSFSPRLGEVDIWGNRWYIWIVNEVTQAFIYGFSKYQSGLPRLI